MPTPNTDMQRALQQQQTPDVLRKLFYVYSATLGGPTVGIASGASGSGNIIIQADSAFMAQFMAALCYNATTFALIDSPIATVQIKDTGTGAELFNEAQFIRNVFGTAGLPLILPTPRIFSPNSSLQFTVNNLNSANPVIYQLSILGRKLYQ